MNEVAEYWMTMPEQRIVHSVININLKPLSAAAVINVMSLVEEITNLSLSLSLSASIIFPRRKCPRGIRARLRASVRRKCLA